MLSLTYVYEKNASFSYNFFQIRENAYHRLLSLIVGGEGERRGQGLRKWPSTGAAPFCRLVVKKAERISISLIDYGS